MMQSLLAKDESEHIKILKDEVTKYKKNISTQNSQTLNLEVQLDKCKKKCPKTWKSLQKCIKN